ncbi:hypothetical protein BCR35DRAFT_350677 [Leucosporidium creatinivorum]|uniref:Uncharacterized protein n=1 Tax=Leucosporidium creatinivorum TaxID=106004 RepID=A0A1Y2FXE4_9BASI|nr:hypothetical protein BCR35DRAFT_350677 [Leucosporidium creatinivorum]
MLPSLRRATSRLAVSLEPKAPCTCGFFSPSRASDGLSSSRKGKEVVRQLQTRSLSSSPALRTESLASTSASPSAASLSSPPPLADSSTSLDDLETALKSQSRAKLHFVLLHLSDEALASIPRPTYDALFDILSTNNYRPGWSRLTASRRWGAIKLLRRLSDQLGFPTRPEHTRKAFRVGVQWERERHERKATGETGEWDTTDQELARRKYLEDLRDEFLRLSKPLTRGRKDLLLLAEYAQAVLAREDDFEEQPNVYSPSTHHPQPPASSDDPPLTYISSSSASAFLPALFRDNPRLALAHLSSMLDLLQLPTHEILRQVLHGAMTSDDDAYAQAREVLDSACTGGARSGQKELDLLLERRLKALEQEEMIAERPVVAFLRWIAMERLPKQGYEALEPTREEWLLLALRLWEGVYGVARWDTPKSRESLELLESLLKEAAPTETFDDSYPERSRAKGTPARSTPPRPSPALVKAIDLSLAHLEPPVLVSLANRLLTSVTIHTQAPSIARHIYFTLRRLAPLHSPKPFEWHIALRPLFLSLVLSASSANDSALVLQLYYEWTSAAMPYPRGAWTPVWRAVGHRSDIDEVARIVGDYEETHRERVASTIVSQIIIASASQPYYLRTLRLVDYLRTRPPRASFNPSLSPVIRIPLRAYNAVLRRIASTYQDRRKESLHIFSYLVADGWKPTTETFNALLAAQVFRPKFHVEDIDNAGEAYNALVRSGCEADEMTLSLVVFGFLRMARGGEKRAVGLQAALATFTKGVEQGKLVRGQQVAGLIRVLGAREKWEDAKGVAERWWRGVVKVQEREGERFGRRNPDGSGRDWRREMKEVEDAQKALTLMESRVIKRRKSPLVNLPSAELDAEIEEQEEVGQDQAAQEIDEDDQAISPIAFPLVDSVYDKS